MQGNIGYAGFVPFLIIIPFFIVVSKPSWLVGYYLYFSVFSLVLLVGMLSNNESMFKDFLKEWYFILIYPLSFIFWYLVRKFIRRRKKE